MVESDAVGVEEVPSQRVICSRAVKRVPYDRMSYACEVHPDLMGSSGCDSHLEIGVPFISSQYPELGKGAASFAEPGGHSDATHRIASNGFRDPAVFLFYRPMNQRQILLLDRAPGKLLLQAAVREIVASDQQHSAGKAVEPVDDAWPILPRACRKTPEAMEQRVHQGPTVAARPRMDDHARRFIHRNDVRVAVQNFNRNVFRFSVQCRWRLRLDLDRFRSIQQIGGFRRRSVHADLMGFDPLLDARAAEIRQMFLKKNIEAFATVGEPR